MSGIWTKFSFLNHSCDENTRKFSIGNFMFIVANRLIQKGEEITTAYCSNDIPYSER